MTRIHTVSPDQTTSEIRQAYAWMTQQSGVVPEPFAVVANHPQLFAALGEMEARAAKAATVLPINIRDLAQYRAAWRIGCAYCIDFSAMLSELHGLREEQLREIDRYATSKGYTDDERAAIAYADSMIDQPPQVTDEQVADLERRFGRDGVVELTFLIALENLRSRMNSALGATAQGFSSGGTCRVPWAENAAVDPKEIERTASRLAE